MKRFFALMIAMMLTLCLTACGGGGSDSDLAYVKDKGTLVVGITDFAPMDYRSDSGEWVGFDADMAKAYAESLGVDVEFIEITWSQKAVELETKAIDVVWNGMTITDEVKGLMGVSNPYCKNAQVVVLGVDAAGDLSQGGSLKAMNAASDLSALSFAVEDGSAGAAALDAEGISYTAVLDQSTALMEVASGSVDACVIDLLMAGAMIGEGTSYPDLVIAVELAGEEYGVGFRKGSDLIENFNAFYKAAYEAGTVMDCAETYGIAKNIIAQ